MCIEEKGLKLVRVVEPIEVETKRNIEILKYQSNVLKLVETNAELNDINEALCNKIVSLELVIKEKDTEIEQLMNRRIH